MGFWNPRAFCPNCGGKIHTQSRGAQSWTGTSCPLCGVALTGRVLGNRAELGTPGAQPLAGPGAVSPPARLGQAIVGLLLIGLAIAGISAGIKACEGRSEHCGGPVYINGVQSDPDCPNYGEPRRP